jgi:hypothetical protein
MEETNTGNQDASALQHEKHKQAARVPKWRVWPTVAVILALLAAAGGGIWTILWFSAAFTDTAVAVNFIVVNILSLFVLLAIIAQACIYLGQRGVMRKQWTAMLDGLDGTDNMIETMQGQLTAVEQQGEHMLSQTKALWNQTDALVTQAKIMAESVVVTRKLVEQNERAIKAAEENVETVEKTSIYANRAYVVAKIKDTGPNDGLLMFRLRIMNNGNTPANDVVVNYAYGLKDKPPHEQTPDGLVVYDAGFTETERLGLVSATGSYHVISTPTVQFPFQHVHPHEHKLWETGSLKFYCWGRIVYEDIFNEKRHTDFCFVLSDEHPTGYPCEHGNQAI